MAEDRESKTVSFTTRVRSGTYVFEIRGDGVRLEQLSGVAKRLEALGLQSAEPMMFDKTPEGLPICPKHRVAMTKREKNGDTWYSHKVLVAGRELYCRGYACNSSPGFDHSDAQLVDDAATEPEPIREPELPPPNPRDRRFGDGLDVDAEPPAPRPARRWARH